MLLRVLPSVYRRQPEPIHRHLRGLAALLPQLQEPGRRHLLRLIQAVAQQRPLVSVREPRSPRRQRLAAAVAAIWPEGS